MRDTTPSALFSLKLDMSSVLHSLGDTFHLARLVACHPSLRIEVRPRLSARGVDRSRYNFTADLLSKIERFKIPAN
jgi:hypothetical protein